jgi:hypothetical protein
MPDHYRYGGGTDGSLLHPFVLCLLVAALIGIFLLPRRYASIPLLGTILLVPVAQQIYVAGLHLFVLRLVILAGLVRAQMSPAPRPRPGSGVRAIDRAFLVCTLAQTIAPILLFQESGALVYQLGYFWDWFGGYVLFRWLLQDETDIYICLKAICILIIPVAAAMIIEQHALFNPFSVLGGVSPVPLVREGKIRSQGVFSHSLMAGSFAAVLMPMLFLLWKQKRAKVIASIGILCATIMVMTSNSSTPLLAYVGGIAALFLWPLRRRMRALRMLLVGVLILLQLVMKAPVWFLIARIDIAGGSSSYHRAALIDQFLRHFSQWWLIGTDQNGTWGLDMFDVQDQYVSVGLCGGLVALVFFLLTISRSFSAIGRTRWRVQGDRRAEWTAWLLGCSLFATVLAFFGVNYFDQGRTIYFVLLAMIAALANRSVDSASQSSAAHSHSSAEWDRPYTTTHEELPSPTEAVLAAR